MKKKYLLYSILPVMVFALLGVGTASACGWGGFFGFGNVDPDKVAERQQAMFERQAQILGISVEEVKNYWAEGKTMKEITEEKGISNEQIQARMKELRLQEMKSYLRALVEKGVITQTQADRRLQVIQSQLENSRIGKGFYKGFGRGFRGFGF